MERGLMEGGVDGERADREGGLIEREGWREG